MGMPITSDQSQSLGGQEGLVSRSLTQRLLLWLRSWQVKIGDIILRISYRGLIRPVKAIHDKIPPDPLPAELVAAAGQPHRAAAILSALILHFDGPERARQIHRISWHAAQGHIDEVLQLEPLIIPLSFGQRLELAGLATRGIKKLEQHRRQQCTTNLRALINADDTVSLFECILFLTLDSALEEESSSLRSLVELPEEVAEQLRTLFDALAYSASPTGQLSHALRNQAMRSLGLPPSSSSTSRPSFERLGWAMRALRRASPALVEQIMHGCAIATSHHKTTSNEQRALLWGIRSCFRANLSDRIEGRPLDDTAIGEE